MIDMTEKWLIFGRNLKSNFYMYFGLADGQRFDAMRIKNTSYFIFLHITSSSTVLDHTILESKIACIKLRNSIQIRWSLAPIYFCSILVSEAMCMSVLANLILNY